MLLNLDPTVSNATKGKRERIGRMLQMHSNNREELKEARTGDIVAIVGLKDTITGDTLCDSANPIILERMEFPEPVIEVAVEPKTKADQEKMSIALGRLASRRSIIPCNVLIMSLVKPLLKEWGSCT